MVTVSPLNYGGSGPLLNIDQRWKPLTRWKKLLSANWSGDSSRNKSIEVTLSIQAGLLDKSIEVSVGFVLTVAFVTGLLD